MKETLDPETEKITRDGQKIADFVKSDGWQLAKDRLLTIINPLDSLTSTIFDGKTNDEIAQELKARASAIEIIKQWIRDVEGTAQQHEANQETSQGDGILVQY